MSRNWRSKFLFRVLKKKVAGRERGRRTVVLGKSSDEEGIPSLVLSSAFLSGQRSLSSPLRCFQSNIPASLGVSSPISVAIRSKKLQN